MSDRYVALHDPENNAGPGDHRRTAVQIVEDQDTLGAWTDKVVLITSCTSGVSIETARALKSTGARVHLTGRSPTKGQSVLADILEPGCLELLELKLDSLASVHACAAALRPLQDRCDPNGE